MALHKSPCSGISLCNLCVLCVSVVWFYSEFINHRDTEDTEVAQRRARPRLFVQSLSAFFASRSFVAIHTSPRAFDPFELRNISGREFVRRRRLRDGFLNNAVRNPCI